MHSAFRHVAMRGVAAAVPRRSIDIADELEFFGNNPKKLARAQKILGYGTRHVVEEGVTAVDLCECAAQVLLEGMEREGREGKDGVDALLLVDQTPDHPHPAGACILQNRLGLPRACAALDVNLGCSGYVYGLWLAHSLIASGACQKVLLCAGDTPSIHSDRRNRLVNPLFGDAGSATLLTRTAEDTPAFFDLGSDGSGWSHIAVPAGGARLRATAAMLEREIVDAAGNPWRLCDALIDGLPVFEFSVRVVPESIVSALALAGKRLAEMDFIALHQANRQIIDEIGARLGLERGGLYSGTFSRYGNQSTASVAGVLCDALAERMAGKRLDVLLCGFGVGFSWATAVLRLDDCYNGGVTFYDKPRNAPTQDELRAFWIRKFLGEQA